MKKIYKIILISLGVLILLLITGTNLILKKVVISSLEDTLNKRVTIKSLWLNPFTGVLSSHDINVWNNEEKPILSLDSLKINTDPLELFRKKLSISEIRLIEPTLNLIYLEGNQKSDKENLTQIEKKYPETSSQSFIREIETKNIAVEKLILIRSSGILKSMNTITFKVPDFTYKDKKLDLSASLNILGSGLVDIKIKANTETGELDTTLASQGFEFNNTFAPNEEGDLNLTGNLKGNIFIEGNYLKKEFKVKGNILGSKVLVKDKKGNEFLNSKSIVVDLENLTFPEISLNLKKLEIEDTKSNLSIFSKKKTPFLPGKKQQVQSLPTEKKKYIIKDIIIDEITIKRSSLIYDDLALTDINLTLKDMKNIPGNKSSASTSFTLNESMNFSSESLVEILNYSTEFDFRKSLILKGNFLFDTLPLDLPDPIKKKLSYEPEIKKVNLKGNYIFSYPNIALKSDIFAENLKFIGEEKQLHNILTKSISGNCSFAYNLDNSFYSLSGLLNFKDFNIKDKKDQDFFLGDISLELGGLKKERITLDSVTLNNFFLDLNTKIFPEKQKYPSTEEITSPDKILSSKEESIEIIIDNLRLRKGQLLTKDLSFTKISLDGNNISNKNINSNFVFDTLINGSGSLKGDLNVKMNNMSTFSDLQVKGDISILNLNLDILNFYIKDLPYEIKGNIDYLSSLDFSKDSISSKGNFLGTNLYIKKDNSIEASVEKIQSKLDFNYKKDEFSLSKSNFSLSNFKGEIKDKTKVQLTEGDIFVEEYSPRIIKFSSISLTSPLIDLKESSQVIGNSQSSKDQKKEDKQPLPLMLASKINVKDGKIIYEGLKKTSVYENIGFSALNFTTQKNKSFPIRADLSLAGIENVELKGNLSLKEDWDFSPKTVTFNGTLDVTKLNIPTFNNLINNNLPNQFDSGILSSSGKINLVNGKLNSEHDISISKIDLGEATGYSRMVPLDSVIKVLSDKYGNISINIPITGNLIDPKLGIASIISSSLMNGLIKTAKSPQNIISKVLSLDNNEIKTIYFNYLSAKPSNSEIDKLNEITDILTKNSKSKVVFTLYTNESVEMNLITTKSIAEIFLGQKIDPKDTLENLIEERKIYILNFFSNKISSERIEVKISQENKPLPQVGVEFEE